MDNRKFESGASATPPTAPATPSSGYPTDGNPATGTPATLPGDYWFHQIGEELRGVLVAAGLTPSSSDLTQLLTALQALMPQFADMTGSLGVNGWFSIPVKIAGVKQKIIIQWGTGTQIAPASNATFTLPIAFPNEFLHAIPFYDGDTALAGAFNVGRASLSQIKIYNTNTVNGATPSYLAFGR